MLHCSFCHGLRLTGGRRTIKRLVFCGDDLISIDLPRRTRVIQAPPPLPGLPDYEGEVRRAIRNPAGAPPLREQVDPSCTVTVAFDDHSLPLPPMQRDIRGRAISVVLDELFSAGVPSANITLVCAVGLHRKLTQKELRRLLGTRVWSQAGRVVNHDAEDREWIVKLGRSPGGHLISLSRLVTESDLLIYVNANWTSMNGGWKSVLVGLGTYETISATHNSDTLLGGGTPMDHRSEFHDILTEMGQVVSRHTRIFSIETVLNNRTWGPLNRRLFSLDNATVPPTLRAASHCPQFIKSAVSRSLRSAYQPIAAHAGSVDQVHPRTLQAVYRQQNVEVDGQSDVLVLGMPNMSPYAAFSRINPLLVLNASLGYVLGMYHGKPLVRKGGILILLQPFLPDFHSRHHPSYREFYERVLPQTRDVQEMEAHFERDFALRPEYIEKYRFHNAYHGVHPFYLWYWCAPLMQHLGRVIVVGAVQPSVIERLGLTCAGSLQEAFAMTRETLGPDHSISHIAIPPIFCTNVS